MADLVVDTYKLNQYAQRLSTVRSRISSLEYRMEMLYLNAGWQDLRNLLRNDPLTSYSKRLKQCRNYLQDTASDFESVESKLQKLDPTKFSLAAVIARDFLYTTTDGRPTIWQGLPKIFSQGTVTQGESESIILDSAWKMFWAGTLSYTERHSVWDKTSEDGEDYFGVLNYEHSTSSGPTKGEYKDKDRLGKEDMFDVNVDQEKKPIYQKNPDESFYDKKGTILEAKAEDKAKVSVLSGNLSGKGEYAQGSVHGDVLTAEAHAGASAGLYVYTKDKDGNVKKVFSPGVSAEVGASVAVAQVGAEGRVGLGENNNMLGIYGNVDAKVLSAEAEGKVAFNRNEIYAGASAEADLVKVSGAGGVSVLGTDVGVSGSLKVGVGAHAEVGITDGKIKVDVGAAVGVGFDLGFEVDVSGTVDAVCDTATAAWDTVTDTWEEAKDVVSEGWDNAKEAVSEGWDNAKEAVSDAWDGAKDAASDAWDGAKDAVSDAWKSASKNWKKWF